MSEAEDRARAGAKELVRRMGPGWKPIVWQHGRAWQYQAHRRLMFVGPECGGYAAGFSDHQQYRACAHTPQQAVDGVVALVQESMVRLNKELAFVLNPPKGRKK